MFFLILFLFIVSFFSYSIYCIFNNKPASYILITLYDNINPEKIIRYYLKKYPYSEIFVLNKLSDTESHEILLHLKNDYNFIHIIETSD